MRTPKLHLLFGQLQDNSQKFPTIFQRKRGHTQETVIWHSRLVLDRVWCLKQLCITSKSFLPAMSPLYVAWPGFALCPEQKQSKQGKLQISTGKSPCWEGAAVNFKFIWTLNKEENNGRSMKIMIGWDLFPRKVSRSLYPQLLWQGYENAGFDFSCGKVFLHWKLYK